MKLSATPLATLSSAGLAAVVMSLSVAAAMSFGEKYGYTMFIGSPLVGGAAAVLLYPQTSTLRVRDVWAVTSLVGLFASLCLLLLGIDGLICVLLSLPVSLPAAWLGGFLVYGLKKIAPNSPTGRGVSAALFPPLWIALALEPAVIPSPQTREVSTELEIEASPSTVWQNVIAFPPITSDLSPIFRLGIAYPMSATIDGQGVGAIRHCVFSTGAFIEPITAWEPGRRLEFDVTENPPPMKEMSFYPDLDVPHLRHNFQSHRGRFLLTPTARGSVVLRGTTWYRQNLWPQFYWNWVSDRIVHRIHLRVLEHIKAGAEPQRT